MLHVKSPSPRLNLDSTKRKNAPSETRKSLSSKRVDPVKLHWSQHDRLYPPVVYRDYLDAIGSPLALSVWMLFKYGEHDQLVQKTIDPSNYNCPQSFRNDYAAVRFFSKCSDLKTTIDRKAVALESARRAEDLCFNVNKRIKEYRSGFVRNPMSSEWFQAQKIIAGILGPLPRSFEDVGWTKGRSSSAFGPEVASVYKYTSRLDTTWSAQLRSLELVRGSHLWGQAALDADGPCSILRSALNIVEGNTMITVPKNAKTDRVICYEPHCNIRLQRAVGEFMANRLLRRGISLSDQSINRRRASFAARHGTLATIDLSMASDTISTELVYELLPIDWALYLDDIRSKHTTWPDGVTRKNEKFSSMGNGFTFELESLIFYALAKAVSDNVSVYGDDLIVNTSDFSNVVDVLESAGFVINKSKSFSSGYFRESCGGDFFGYHDVTPVYLRSLVKSLDKFVLLHNSIREWNARDAFPSLSYALLLKKMRDSRTHLCGPSGYGDGHYHVNLDEISPWRASNGIEGWWFNSMIPRFKVSRLYGDRVSGHFSGRYVAAALAAATGPRRLRDTVQATTDRRLVVYSRVRILANSWPEVIYW